MCADEKPSIRARSRIATTLGARARRRLEGRARRNGALYYPAAWDARRAKIFDRCAR
jgi:hypothetical protein